MASKSPTNSSSVGGQLKNEFRNRLIAAIAAGLVAGFVASVVAIWTYLQSYVAAIGLVPRNSVVAFMGECPSQGWEPFHEGDGKFIVGAGSDGRLDPKSNGASTGVSRSLASYFVSDQGGEESRVLSEEYIPRHTHSISAVFDTEILNGFGGSEATYGLSPKFNKNAPTKPGWSQSIFEDFMSAFGGDKDGKTLPLSNLPPYIALNWCRRTG